MAKLGKSFGDLFEDNSFDEDESVTTIKISDIEPNKSQPRKNFDPEGLRNLADSIRQNGLIQPLLVRNMPDGTYQIVAGERRWRACKMAGITEIPVFIRDLSDLEVQQLALIENLQRENLNPVEEANGYKELIESYDMTQEEVAKVVGKARSSIANSLRILTLPEEVMELAEKGQLSTGHCKAILGMENQAQMISLAKKVAEKEISVRETERLAKGATLKKPKQEKLRDNFYTEAEISLASSLGTKVTICEGKRKSTVEIEFYSKDELVEIIKKLAAE